MNKGRMLGEPIAVDVAKRTMAAMLQAQQSGQYVEWVPFYGRVSLSGYSNAEGLVEARSINMFAATQSGSQTQAGFARQLTDADISLRAGDASMPAAQEYIGFFLGIATAPEMPDWIARAVVYYGTLTQSRGNTFYSYGGVQQWPASYMGLQARAAATGVAGESINQHVNGILDTPQGLRPLPKGALLPLPAKQPIEFSLNLRRPFYCTTTGGPVSAGGVKIDNTGAYGPDVIGTYKNEVCALVTCVMFGLQFTMAG